MNIKNQRRARRSMTLGINHLESRQMLTGVVPVHGAVPLPRHRHLPIARAVVVGHVHTGDTATSAKPAVFPLAAPDVSSVPSFRIVPSPTITRSGLKAVARISDNDIWAVGNTQHFNTGDVVALAEHFDGMSWTSVSIPYPASGFGGELSGLAAVASNNVWAVGYSVYLDSFGDSVASTLIERYNGTSWNIVSSPNPTGGGVLTAVTATSANNIWAVGHMGIGRGGNLIEHLDGTSWSIVASPQGPDTFLTSVSGTSASDVWAVGSIGRGDSIQILHINGTSWSDVSGLPADSVLESVVAIAPNNVWAVGADIEHFDGTSWSIVPSSGVGQFGPASIAAFSANDIYAVGGGIEHWDGTSWSSISAPVPPNTRGALFSGVTTLSTGNAVAVGLAQPLTGPNNYHVVIEQN
jgi:hypothetical protein